MTDTRVSPVAEIIRQTVAFLIDHPEALAITAKDLDGCTTFNVQSDPRDVGKLIGKQGRTVKAMRTLINAIGMAEGWRYALTVEGDATGAYRGFAVDGPEKVAHTVIRNDVLGRAIAQR